MTDPGGGTMEVRVLYFASMRKFTRRKEEKIELPENARVIDLKDHIGNRYPPAQASLPTILTAVNHEFSDDDTPLGEGDEVAFFPHVSGG